LKKCPHCGGKVERLLAPPAIQFKGSGWYVTDYAGKKSGDAAPAKETGSGETAAKDSAAKDSAKTPAKESKDKKAGKK
jgi:predicted nucleic acid-binding Zn ribbon protein